MFSFVFGGKKKPSNEDLHDQLQKALDQLQCQLDVSITDPVPSEFICPINLTYITLPARLDLDNNKQYYEKDALNQLKINGYNGEIKSPLTRKTHKEHQIIIDQNVEIKLRSFLEDMHELHDLIKNLNSLVNNMKSIKSEQRMMHYYNELDVLMEIFLAKRKEIKRNYSDQEQTIKFADELYSNIISNFDSYPAIQKIISRHIQNMGDHDLAISLEKQMELETYHSHNMY